MLAAGPKREVLSNQVLSAAFGCPVTLSEVAGRYTLAIEDGD